MVLPFTSPAKTIGSGEGAPADSAANNAQVVIGGSSSSRVVLTEEKRSNGVGPSRFATIAAAAADPSCFGTGNLQQ